MTTKQWKTKLKKACVQAGTYDKVHDITIEECAQILEMRDKALWEFEHVYDNQVIVTHTNRAGAENLAKNPALTALETLWTQALAHLRDLGLTPKGLKAMGGTLDKKEEASSFEKLFSDLGI